MEDRVAPTNDSLRRLFQRLRIVAIDAAVMYISALLASYALFSHFQFVLAHYYLFFIVIGMQLIFFTSFRLYYIRLVDSSLDLVARGAGAMILSSVAVLFFMLWWTRDFAIATRFTSVYIAFVVVFLLGYRVLYRMSVSYSITKMRKPNGQPRAIVYGAGEIGMQLARQFHRSKLDYHIVGFIDDDEEKQHLIVQGITVMGSLQTLPTLLRGGAVDVLIIAITNLSSEKIREALDIAGRFDIETKIIPSLFEMEEQRKGTAELRDIQFEDLLGRSVVTFDKTPIAEMVENKCVLVTGAGGSIGSEISRQILSYQPAKLLLLDTDETELHDLSLRLHRYQHEFSERVMPIVCDVRNSEKIEKIFETYHIDIVFHAAAYKHVPMMEYYPEEAFKTNVGGTYNVFTSAVKHQSSRCILVSTDKAVNPTNVMGATKRVAEMVASMLSNETTEIVCVRFGNVLGSRGSMLPLFLEQMREGFPITITDKRIIRYFMTVQEAVSLVSLAGALGKGKEVMVLDMGEAVNIYDFAKRLVRHFGDGKNEIIITGLRPGEKLYEEKLSDKDKTIPTDNPKLFKAIVNQDLDYNSFQKIIDSMEALESDEFVTLLQELVPEYTNSEKRRSQFT